MVNFEDRIKEVMSKNIISKTKLVAKEDLEKEIKLHELQGFKVVNQVEVNGRIKVTFQQIK